MFDKFFVGGDVMSSVNNGKFKPISRVTLLLDDSNAITAGDDTGREIVANCPHATQKMVDNLLASLRGYEYQAYEADSANIDPSAELGDGVTVGGVYSVIATLRDDGSGYASLSAPGEAELEDEYPMDGPMTQMFNRKLASTRSYIKKSVDELRLEVFGEEGSGEESSLAVKLGQIALKVDGKIDGEAAQALIDTSLKDIKLSVSNGADSSTITLKAGDTEIKSPEIKMTGVVTLKGLREGTTTIDGGWIETDSLKADKLHLGGLLTVYDGLTSNDIGGYIGYDAGYNSGAGIGIRYASENGAQCVCTNQAARISYTLELGGMIYQSGVTCSLATLTLDANQSMGLRFFQPGDVGEPGKLVQMYGIDESSVYPSSTGQTLGTDTLKWADVYAAGTSFSSLVARVAALEAK